MPARLSVHLPERPALVRWFDDGARATLGRGDDCDVIVAHGSVSRRHAEIASIDGHWLVRDLGSKNGVRIAGARVDEGRVSDGGWFSIGDVFCRMEALTVAEREELEARAGATRSQSAAWLLKLERADGEDTLLRDMLAAIVSLAGCRRGFLLAGRDGRRMMLAASHGAPSGATPPPDVSSPATLAFAGSTGAVQRALLERRAVYMGRADDGAWLAGRPSIATQSLRALVALPLVHEGDVLGLAYADSDEPGKTFTELDAELLDAFAQQAAIALAAHGLGLALADLEAWVAAEVAA